MGHEKQKLQIRHPGFRRTEPLLAKINTHRSCLFKLCICKLTSITLDKYVSKQIWHCGAGCIAVSSLIYIWYQACMPLPSPLSHENSCGSPLNSFAVKNMPMTDSYVLIWCAQRWSCRHDDSALSLGSCVCIVIWFDKVMRYSRTQLYQTRVYWVIVNIEQL